MEYKIKHRITGRVIATDEGETLKEGLEKLDFPGLVQGGDP